MDLPYRCIKNITVTPKSGPVPRQASGCILDQLEKVCEGEAAEMIMPNALENVWMCCHLDHHLDPMPMGIIDMESWEVEPAAGK